MKTSKMIKRARVIVYLIGFLILVPQDVWTQTPAATGKSTIKIRAIYEDNERPVRRAEVTLQSEEMPFIWRRGVTDAKGEATINNVPAGTYTILLGFTGVMNGNSGFSSKSSATVDGSSRSEVTMRAKRGGALTGKITYPDGEPVTSAKVTALTKRGKRWQNVLQPVSTDDRGIFRIYPLNPGEYIVSAFEEGVVITELPEGGSSHSTTNMSVSAYFYGGGHSLKSAQVIQLEPAREVGNINITLTERALYKLSGTVLGAGVPLPGASLSLRVKDEGDAENPGAAYHMGANTQSDSKGVWSFEHVPEGSYYLEMIREQTVVPVSSGRDTQRFAWQPYPVNVTNGDIENIVFSAEEGARVSGTVTVEGDKPIPRGEIFLRRTGGVAPQSWRDGIQLEPASKGAFRLDGVAAGEHFLVMTVWDRDHYVKFATWNDRDLLRSPLTLGAGRNLTGIKIVLATDVTDAKGRLIYADNKAVGPNLIMLVPVDESLWLPSSFRFTASDKQGGFKYRGAPGEYGLIVVPRGEEPNSSFGYVREQMTNAPRINLKPGEQDLKDIVVRTP